MMSADGRALTQISVTRAGILGFPFTDGMMALFKARVGTPALTHLLLAGERFPAPR
jgi:hypothetical protein